MNSTVIRCRATAQTLFAAVIVAGSCVAPVTRGQDAPMSTAAANQQRLSITTDDTIIELDLETDNPIYGLALGFDSLTGQFKAPAFKPVPPSDDAQAIRSTFASTQVSSYHDLRTTLGIAASAKVQGGFWNSRAKLEMLNSTNINSFSTIFAVRARVAVSRTFLSPPDLQALEITPEARRILARHGVSGFRDTYGDYFISGLRRGAEVFGTIRFDHSGLDERERFHAELSASGVVAGGSIDLQKLSRVSTGYTSKHVNFESFGVKVPDVPRTIEALDDLAARLSQLALDQTESLGVVGIQLANYSLVPGQPSLPSVSEARRELDRLGQLAERVEQSDRAWEYVLENPGQFPLTSTETAAANRRASVALSDEVRAAAARVRQSPTKPDLWAPRQPLEERVQAMPRWPRIHGPTTVAIPFNLFGKMKRTQGDDDVHTGNHETHTLFEQIPFEKLAAGEAQFDRNREVGFRVYFGIKEVHGDGTHFGIYDYPRVAAPEGWRILRWVTVGPSHRHEPHPFVGERHGEFDYPLGSLAGLRDIKARIDTPEANDQPHIGIKGEILIEWTLIQNQ